MDKELVIAVCDRLETEVPDLRWIDLEEGQLNSSERPAVAFPCALVDMAYVDCKNHLAGSQRVRAGITLRVAFTRAGATNTAAPVSVRRQALARLDTLQKIHKALQWWGGGGLCNPIRRLRCVPEKRSDGLRVYTMTYETEFMD